MCMKVAGKKNIIQIGKIYHDVKSTFKRFRFIINHHQDLETIMKTIFISKSLMMVIITENV